MGKNFLLLSMEDEKIKKISNVISNESCRKILDYLADKEATESELSAKLNIPISTVHYNLQQLMETGMIDAEEYHYSQKGKEVNHYRLANKYIIIAPKKTFGIKEKLKSILPVALIAGGAALVLRYSQKFFASGSVTKIFENSKQILVRETIITQQALDSVGGAQSSANSIAAPAMSQGVSAAKTFQAPQLINKTTEYLTAPQVSTQTIAAHASIWSNVALWFFIGAVFALIIYMILGMFKKNSD